VDGPSAPEQWQAPIIEGTMCGRPFLCKEEIGSDD
jgi:hypothetical protein